MNVYDKAHELAQAIKQSEEFKQYDGLKVQVEANEQIASMVHDFQAKQMEFQAKQLSGETPDSSAIEQIQQLYGIITKDPLAANYMQAEMRFSLMMKDVYEILGEAMGLNGKLG